MQLELSPEDVVAAWTLVEDDWRLVGNKTGVTRLGFAVLLKFFDLEGRFPGCAQEVPGPAVEYVAGQVMVEPELFAKYAWAGRTIEYHRAQIRRVFGFRESTRADEERLASWLAVEVCGIELADERLADALVGAGNSATLCDLGIFMDEPAEPVAPNDLDIGVDGVG
jgi:hypothetical protein